MFRVLFGFLAVILGLCALAFIAAFLYVAPNLPEIDALRDVRLQVPLRVYSRDGSLIAEFGEKRRALLRIDEAPKQLVNAFLAAEDDRFFEHPGVDWQGLVRAAIALAATGEKRQGGSTITMQVARNFFLTREKSYIRKLNEIFLAFKIERELSKNEILELYLNKIFLGQRAYGVSAAAQIYYGKPLAELNLAQHAMLAGLPKAPSNTNPVSNQERAVKRRNYVLRRMFELDYIDRAQFDEADNAPVTASLHRAGIELEAPYIAEMARDYVTEAFGVEAYSEGYIVTTTIRDKHQAAANRAIAETLLKYDQRHGYRGPEGNHALDEGDDEERWEQLLDDYPSVGGLLPALVIAAREQSVAAYVAGVGPVDIGWDGLLWARPYRDENRRAPPLERAGDILEAGDVIRVNQEADGSWRLAQTPAVQGSLVSLAPRDGAVLALTGGFNYYHSKFNRVTQAKRQPGSSFKPFIYSAALKNGYTPASIINDAPVVYDDPGLKNQWRPENYSGKTRGPTRLRVALRHSINLVSIRLLHALGVPNALSHIAKFGFDTEELPKNLSLALGSGAVTPWELANAYAVFANGGYQVEPYFIDRVETASGELLFEADPATVCVDCPVEGFLAEAGAVAEAGLPELEIFAEAGAVAEAGLPELEIFVDAPPEAGDGGWPEAEAVPIKVAKRVVSQENVWIMNHLTRDVVRYGTGKRAYQKLGRNDLSGKTGTTNEQRDAWFAGFNASVVAIAWVGFDSFDPLGEDETGARAALPMWIAYMGAVLEQTPAPAPLGPIPANIVNLRINRETGCPARANDDNAEFEFFVADNLPDETACNNMAPRYASDALLTETPERIF